MDWVAWVAVGVGVVALGAIAQRRGWIDLSDKSRSGRGGGGVVAIGDEVFHPSKHEAAIELDRQSVLPAPAPLPGDRGDAAERIYEGRVTIDLGERRTDDRGGAAD